MWGLEPPDDSEPCAQGEVEALAGRQPCLQRKFRSDISWSVPTIVHFVVQGKWAPRKIDNPAYFEEDALFTSFSSISAVGFELWSMTKDILIDNIIVCGELAIANNYARDG